MADPRGAPGMRAPLGVQILSFCSFAKIWKITAILGVEENPGSATVNGCSLQSIILMERNLLITARYYCNRTCCKRDPVYCGGCQWRIQDFPEVRGNLQPSIFPNFPNNCMKLKEFGPPGGWHASKILLYRSATGFFKPVKENHLTCWVIWRRKSMRIRRFPASAVGWFFSTLNTAALARMPQYVPTNRQPTNAS